MNDNPGHYDNREEQGQEVGPADMQQLDVISAAEINQQIATAKRFPRSITKFRREALELVTQDPIIAEQCTYVLPARKGSGGKEIEGPSVRFAEIILACWGNIRTAARTAGFTDDGDYLKAEGVCYDLERNNAIKYEVLRRITDRDGNRYSSDMVGVTGNAGCSIALRNAVLRVVPRAFWQDIWEKAKACADGSEEGFNKKRERLLKAFSDVGATNQQVFDLVEIAGAHDLKTEHLMKLAGILTAIRDGDLTVEAAFDTKPVQANGQASPGAKNEFVRTDKPAETKPAPAETKAAPTETKPAPAEVKKDPEPTEPKEDNQPRDALAEWLSDQTAEITSAATVKAVNEVLERVLSELGEKHPGYLKIADFAGKKSAEILRAQKKKK